MTKRIVFEYQYGSSAENVAKEVFEFENDITEEEIQEEYVNWMVNLVGDRCTWYEL